MPAFNTATEDIFEGTSDKFEARHNVDRRNPDIMRVFEFRVTPHIYKKSQPQLENFCKSWWGYAICDPARNRPLLLIWAIVGCLDHATHETEGYEHYFNACGE